MTEPKPEYDTEQYTSECHINPNPMGIVNAVGEIHFEGNVIPHSWYEHLRWDNGKADLVAITLLAEIVYWHRPVIEKDETTGKLKPPRRKFKADKWQRGYQSLADQFGLSKRRVADALKRLRKKGLITMEFRSLLTKTGLHLSNVLYIELQPEALKTITFTHMTPPPKKCDPLPPKNVTPPTIERNPSYDRTEPLPPMAGGTYPQIPSEIPSETSSPSEEKDSDSAAEPSPFTGGIPKSGQLHESAQVKDRSKKYRGGGKGVLRKKSARAQSDDETVICSIHGAYMQRREKDGRVWYSHRLSDGSYCNGADQDQPGREKLYKVISLPKNGVGDSTVRWVTEEERTKMLAWSPDND